MRIKKYFLKNNKKLKKFKMNTKKISKNQNYKCSNIFMKNNKKLKIWKNIFYNWFHILNKKFNKIKLISNILNKLINKCKTKTINYNQLFRLNNHNTKI